MKKRIKNLVVIIMVALISCTSVSANQPVERFDLKFPGGKPKALVEAIRQAVAAASTEPVPINVLLPSAVEDIEIPPVEMRSVDLDALFNALNYVMGDQTRWMKKSPNVWVLAHAGDDRKAQAFYVGHLLKKFKIEDITTAVKTTWEFGKVNKQGPRPELKYHEDTQLLIALAASYQLSTVVEVLAQLKLALEENAKSLPAR